MPSSTGDLDRFTSTQAHGKSFPVSRCFFAPVLAPVFSSPCSACYYFPPADDVP